MNTTNYKDLIIKIIIKNFKYGGKKYKIEYCIFICLYTKLNTSSKIIIVSVLNGF